MTKKELEQKLEQLQKQLDELKKVTVEEPKKKWIPAENEEYYYITSNLETMFNVFCDDEYDKDLIEIGNCFKTKEEAQSVADKIKYTLMFKNYVEEHSEPLDWNDKKWCINYNNITHTIDFDYYKVCKYQGTIYASSKQIIEDAIAYIGKDNVKKYILEVED